MHLLHVCGIGVSRQGRPVRPRPVQHQRLVDSGSGLAGDKTSSKITRTFLPDVSPVGWGLGLFMVIHGDHLLVISGYSWWFLSRAQKESIYSYSYLICHLSVLLVTCIRVR